MEPRRLREPTSSIFRYRFRDFVYIRKNRYKQTPKKKCEQNARIIKDKGKPIKKSGNLCEIQIKKPVKHGIIKGLITNIF